MQKTKYFTLHFNEAFMPYEIPAFRAAVIEATQRQSTLFHNHKGDKQFFYRYPLVQYKIVDKRPCIVCLNDATADIGYLLENKDFNFRINNRKQNFTIADYQVKMVIFQTWDADFAYHLHNWLPLNQENYEKYKKTKGLVAKMKMLETILYNNLVAIIKQLGIDEVKPLKVELLEIRNEKSIQRKGIYHVALSLNFMTNLSMPNYLGVGQGASVGFGMVKRINL